MPDSALNDDLPEALKAVRTRHLFVMRLSVRKLQTVGSTAERFPSGRRGVRRIIRG